MNQWGFVTAAYLVAIAGTTALLVWAYLSMRRAEAQSDKLRSRE